MGEEKGGGYLELRKLDIEGDLILPDLDLAARARASRPRLHRNADTDCEVDETGAPSRDDLVDVHGRTSTIILVARSSPLGVR